MTRSFQNGIVSCAVGLVAIVIGQIFLVRNQNLGPELVLKREARIITTELSKARQTINKVLPALKLDNNNRVDSFVLRELKAAGIDLFVYTNNQPAFWTTNSYNVAPIYGRNGGVQIQKNASKYVALWSIFRDTQEILFGKAIIRNPEFRFVSGATLQEERHNKFGLSAN